MIINDSQIAGIDYVNHRGVRHLIFTTTRVCAEAELEITNVKDFGMIEAWIRLIRDARKALAKLESAR